LKTIQEQASFFLPESHAVDEIVKTSIAAEKSSLSALGGVSAILTSAGDLIQSTLLILN